MERFKLMMTPAQKVAFVARMSAARSVKAPSAPQIAKIMPTTVASGMAAGANKCSACKKTIMNGSHSC